MKSIEDFPISKAVLRTTFGNGEIWDIPVLTIAKSRATRYVEEFGDGISSLVKDTLPLFQGSHSEITDWALDNMYWSEIREDAIYRGMQQVIEPVDADKAMEWSHSEYTMHRLILEPVERIRGKTGAWFPIEKIFIHNPGDDSVGIMPTTFTLTIEGDTIFDPLEQEELAESYLDKLREEFTTLFENLIGDGGLEVTFEGENN